MIERVRDAIEERLSHKSTVSVEGKTIEGMIHPNDMRPFGEACRDLILDYEAEPHPDYTEVVVTPSRYTNSRL